MMAGPVRLNGELMESTAGTSEQDLSTSQRSPTVEEEMQRYQELSAVRDHIANKYKIAETFYCPEVEYRYGDGKIFKHRKITCLNLAKIDDEKTYNLNWRHEMLEEEKNLPFSSFEGGPDRIYFKKVKARNGVEYIVVLGEKKIGKEFHYAVMPQPSRRWVDQLRTFINLHIGTLGLDEANHFRKIITQLGKQSPAGSYDFLKKIEATIEKPAGQKVIDQAKKDRLDELFHMPEPGISREIYSLMNRSMERSVVQPSHFLTPLSGTNAHNLSWITLSKADFPKSFGAHPLFTGEESTHASIAVLKNQKPNGSYVYRLMKSEAGKPYTDILPSNSAEFVAILTSIQAEAEHSHTFKDDKLLNEIGNIHESLAEKYGIKLTRKAVYNIGVAGVTQGSDEPADAERYNLDHLTVEPKRVGF